MPTVKTAISLPEPLFHRAETVAHDLQISRSQLVAKAIDEFIRRYERQALIEAINDAFRDDPPTAEETELLKVSRRINGSSGEGALIRQVDVYWST